MRLTGVRLVSPPGLIATLGDREGVVRWRLEVRDPLHDRRLAVIEAEGEPPPEVELAFTASVAGTLIATAEYPGGVRFRSRPVPLPPWSPDVRETTISGPALRDPSGALADLIERELDSLSAKIAVRIDGGTEAQRARVLAALSELPLIETPPARLEGELTLTARLVYDESVELPRRESRERWSTWGSLRRTIWRWRSAARCSRSRTPRAI